MLLEPNDHILFYGDSITDCGRNRDAQPNDSSGWGFGYAHFCAARLGAELPDWNLQFSNQGISGNRVYDLEERLQSDVLDLKPNLVSILIGINDVWRRFDSGVVSNLNEFAQSYTRIAQKITDSGARLLICEPFLLPVPDDRRAWREDLAPKIEACREVARQFNAVYVPLDGEFQVASCRRDSAFWLPDGVHPSPAGHALIAEAWLSAVME